MSSKEHHEDSVLAFSVVRICLLMQENLLVLLLVS